VFAALASPAFFVYDNSMSRSTIIVNEKEKKRGRGRPRTGMDPVVAARIPPDLLAEIVQWAADNDCSRSDAIVHFLKRGVTAAKPRRKAKP
jgi:hypothetical protein